MQVKFVHLLLIASAVLNFACQETKPSSQKMTGAAQTLHESAGHSLPSEVSGYHRRYAFNEPGCSTGAHEFSSEKKFCMTLLDDESNRSCARPMREALYTSECSGSSVVASQNLTQGNQIFCKVSGVEDGASASSKKTYINQEFIRWDRSHQYGIRMFGGSQKQFGLVYLNLLPKVAAGKAQAQMVFNSQEGQVTTVLKTGANRFMEVEVAQTEAAKIIKTDCKFPTKKKTPVLLRGAVCEYYLGAFSDKVKKYSSLNMNLAETDKTEIMVGNPTGVSFKVKLEIVDGQTEVAIDVPSSQISHGIKARSALSEGLSLSHWEEQKDRQLNIRCYAPQN